MCLSRKKGGFAIKRNLDLIRALLLWAEANCNGTRLFTSTYVKIEGYKLDEINFHLMLLQDCGYIDSSYDSKLGRTKFVHFSRLTSQGCDYLDSVRDNSVWDQTKSKLASVGGSAALETIKAVAAKVAIAAIFG